MNIVVPVRLVPDLVEELVIDESGAALDATALRLILNEFDDHAIEQAILLKERNQGQVIILATEAEGVDDALYTAAAKGADRLIKVIGLPGEKLNNHALAGVLAGIIKELQPGLILTGVQAHNDLDGSMGPLLAGYLGLPYIGYVAGVMLNDGKAIVRKEFSGGLVAEIETVLPAVLGIQAAENPPRYVAFSKIRQAMKTISIDEQPMVEPAASIGPSISRMFHAESGERATMIAGSVDEVAARLVKVLQESGVL